MHGRHHRTSRVDDQAHARGVEPRGLAAPGTQTGRRSRRELAGHLRAVDSRLLERRAFGQHAGDAAASARPVPPILAERSGAVEASETLGHLVVEPRHQCRHALPDGRCGHGVRHSFTASTNARAFSTGTSGWMPCPRLAMCPPPAKAASISRVRSRIVAGGA